MERGDCASVKAAYPVERAKPYHAVAVFENFIYAIARQSVEFRDMVECLAGFCFVGKNLRGDSYEKGQGKRVYQSSFHE